MKILNLKETSKHDATAQSVKILRAEGLVIYPTETVYGAGVDATNPAAVKKLGEYKSRPFGKPFSIAVADWKMAEKYVVLNETAKKLYRQFLPGPLTIISKLKTLNSSNPSNHFLSPGVASEAGTLGIRISSYPLVAKIVRSLGRPITATSANEAYKKRPYQISDILFNISDRKKQLIDLIIDAGELPRNEPSTVIDTTLDDQTVLRQGDIQLKDKIHILSRTPENTQNLAKELWQKYEGFVGKRAIIFALEGQLGAGKTEFTKGLARAMGIKKEITSPTFNLVNHYSLLFTPYSLLHIDAWRLESSSELGSLDFSKTISDKSVIAVEWADRVTNVIRRYQEEAVIIWVKIKYGKSKNDRLISWGIF
ncbi:threonylcarbamoyl-AMP synthase [Candidatus Collierbacteria bacterium]|nr:threonylcarbamoyl-AMP synthase [Candidatus Collierbacteria bacterium]